MSIAPVALKVNGKEYILTDVNEQRVKKELYKRYKSDTLVEEVVDGEKINELELQDIFTK